MPPPLLTHILCLLSYQTGRCLLTFCGCHTHTHLERPSLSVQRKGDHYCCRQQLFFVYVQYHRFSFSFYSRFSHTDLTRLLPQTRVCLQRWLLWTCHIYASYISALPSVGPGSSVCHVIDMIMLGNGGKICWEWFSWEWCVAITVFPLNITSYYCYGMKWKVPTKFSSVKIKLQGYHAINIRVEGIILQ